MKIPKPTEGDRERFTGLVPDAPNVEVKPMFGNLGAFVNGNMFAGLHEDRVVLRLDEEGAAEAKALGATDFEPMPGRRMAGWVAVTGKPLADEARLRKWIGRAFAHVSAMPAKPRKAAGRKRARAASRQGSDLP